MKELEREIANLKEEILELLKLKREGEYWDFKRQWYKKEKTDDLLIDIICMANNLVDRDCYIIIGVDEENDFKITDVSSDENRKNTQNIVDFLRNKPFAGNVRPEVYVRTIKLEENVIDVIVIKNAYTTPYYLTQKYRSLFPNNIYARIEDTNTDRDKSADVNIVEKLWKKRFRIDKSPIEKVTYYLENKDKWVGYNEGEVCGNYYEEYPEYKICTSFLNDRDGYEFYLFTQIDSRPNWYDIDILYKQTKIWTGIGIALDGGRAFTNVPETEYLACGKQGIIYKYYVENTLPYQIHKFFFNESSDEARWANRKFMECILVFKNLTEKELFDEYISSLSYSKIDFKKYDSKKELIPDIEGYKKGAFVKEFIDSLFLKDELNIFREKLSGKNKI